MNRTKESLAQSERDDYNVRRYAFHIYYGYSVILYTSMAFLNLYDAPTMVLTFYGVQELGPGGLYYARQTAALMLVMAVFTLYGWTSKSGPVKDLLIKTHLTHHLFSMLMDWLSEYQGITLKQWQQGVFTPHPFFTFLVLFMWATDKRRDLEQEQRELEGKDD